MEGLMFQAPETVKTKTQIQRHFLYWAERRRAEVKVRKPSTVVLSNTVITSPMCLSKFMFLLIERKKKF